MVLKLAQMAVLLLLMSFPLCAEDAVTLSQQISSSSEQHFYLKEFLALNELDNEFNDPNSRLPDGRWKLTFLYQKFAHVSARGAEAEWQHKFDLVNEWLSLTPGHAAPYLAKAEILLGYAWDARGRGWANKVSKKQWQLFAERVDAARDILTRPVAANSHHPYWYLLMEIIGNLQNWPEDEFTKLYQQATDKYPTYYYLHFRAADYYQPRWHGSKIKLKNFVENAVNKSKLTEGMTLYARIYWSQLWALKDNTFSPGYAEWPLMKQGFERIMQDYPDSLWNLNGFAFYACMAEDWHTARELLNRIGDNPHLSIWNSKAKYFACRANVKNNLAASD